ncbi:hypothetical protein GCM10008090_04450 [Arenicella chitinivorans]|uniref:VanZ family protein n=1 Tax=Arenicella chitinivorans TaxID=1329800 RepID=A0A918RGC6_9GAMM|nr:hypothetical protein [Arenicella chitinivorans]GGZ99009.1 hypothetical protein GCM10008090_04450 [Arenicella chitinivorans]
MLRLEAKWFYRMLLLTVLSIGSYVVLQPQYNFSHWMPHRALRSVGVPYDAILWFEQNADIALHLLGGLFITALLYASNLPLLKQSAAKVLACTVGLCLLAEILQLGVGRNVELKDLLLGISGSFMAYLTIKQKKKINRHHTRTY